jgi:lipoyl(octanoyl) transferase
MQPAHLTDLGTLAYRKAWDLQLGIFNEKVEARRRGESLPGPAHHLLLVEHPHVYTLGKSANKANLLANAGLLESIGADTYEIERGGDITYHGPGQLVAYPIFDLEALNIGVKKFVEYIELAIIKTLEQFGIQAGIIPDRIGVWLDIDGPRERKIAAIGIKCSRFISMHGLALNVNTDLGMFNHIVPCGIVDKTVTSMERELARHVDMLAVKRALVQNFETIFDINLQKSK